jgi:predicted ATPase/DNA-binding SARP family transcriptional activator
VEFRVLGPLQVVVDGAPVVLRGAAERALLTRLLLDAGRVVPAERLIDDLWGEELPANALNALQGRVSRLRRALRGIGLAESLVVSRRPGYLLDVDRDAVDLHRFTRLLEEARRTAEHGATTAGRQYAAALALWPGPALGEFEPEPWARDQRLRLEELRLAATEEWFEVRLAAGQHAELVGELTELVARYPLRERLHGQLMIALYRSGRQAEALAAYQSARQTLDDELGLDPSPELRELEQAMLRQDAALAAPPRARRAEPSPLAMRLTSFVGRDRERLALRELLGSRRLVTLTGPGGVGKTSLALDVVAADLAPDGSWFVGLAGVADDEGLGPAVADAVGAPTGPGSALDRAIRHLHRRESLLVLDNCEHLTEACATVANGLLTGCAGVRVLATSREPLGISGEAQFPVAPLPIPPADATAVELAVVDAVRLFVDRARDADPGFVLDATTGPAVAHICRQLDGLPLAIELAAARVKVLPVGEIVTRLRDRFRLLTSGPRTAEPRQRTLRAAVDWSHQMLTDPERVLFRRLSVFRGGWDLTAAEQVCAGHPIDSADILDLHTRLVDRSLVTAGRGPGARFGMLETLRQYADERLVAAAERDRGQAAHAAYFTRLATAAEPRLRGAEQDRLLAVLRAERDNLRAALAWGHANPTSDLGLRLAAALGWFWYFTSAREGVSELETMLTSATTGSRQTRARALQALSVVARPGACIVHPDPRCAAAAGESRELFTRDGEPTAAAYSTTLLAVEGIAGTDPAGALAMLDEAAAQFDRVGEDWGRALVLFVRMELQFLTGDADAATRHGRQALELYRALDDHWGTSAVAYHHGLALHRAGRLDAALGVHEAALAQGRMGLTNTVPYVLADMGHIALQLGDSDRAAQHFVEARDAARRLGAEGNAPASIGEGDLARERGDPPAATRHYRAALRLLAGQGAPESEAAALNGLGLVAARSADLDSAEDHHRAALRAAARSPASGARAAAAALEGLAQAAAGRGDAGRAANLLGTAARWRQWRHQPAGRTELQVIDRATTQARAALGDQAFDEAYARGLEPPPGTVVDLQQSAQQQLSAWLREPVVQQA